MLSGSYEPQRGQFYFFFFCCIKTITDSIIKIGLRKWLRLNRTTSKRSKIPKHIQIDIDGTSSEKMVTAYAKRRILHFNSNQLFSLIKRTFWFYFVSHIYSFNSYCFIWCRFTNMHTVHILID